MLLKDRLKRWIKESLQPISTSIEDMQREAKERAAERASRPKEESPEDVMFRQMTERRDRERALKAKREKEQAIRDIAHQLLADKSKHIDTRCERLSHRDGQEALEQAQRIYELTETFKLPEAQTQE